MIEDYYYKTENPHSCNSVTMSDFLEFHSDEYLGKFELLEVDENEAIIIKDNIKYRLVAIGNGDFCNHAIEFEELK